MVTTGGCPPGLARGPRFSGLVPRPHTGNPDRRPKGHPPSTSAPAGHRQGRVLSGGHAGPRGSQARLPRGAGVSSYVPPPAACGRNHRCGSAAGPVGLTERQVGVSRGDTPARGGSQARLSRGLLCRPGTQRCRPPVMCGSWDATPALGGSQARHPRSAVSSHSPSCSHHVLPAAGVRRPRLVRLTIGSLRDPRPGHPRVSGAFVTRRWTRPSSSDPNRIEAIPTRCRADGP